MTIRMSWCDYKNDRFMYGGVFHPIILYPKASSYIRTDIMFLLNIYRERWVSVDDILFFLYEDEDPDLWGDYQVSSIRVAIHDLKKMLPDEIKIESDYRHRYKLGVV